jgi:hypothetical protein
MILTDSFLIPLSYCAQVIVACLQYYPNFSLSVNDGHGFGHLTGTETMDTGMGQPFFSRA